MKILLDSNAYAMFIEGNGGSLQVVSNQITFLK